jgi:hypothetical protein
MLLLKIIGALVLVWVAFIVLGAVFKIIGTLLVIGAIVTIGAVGYAAIKGRSGQRQIRR